MRDLKKTAAAFALLTGFAGAACADGWTAPESVPYLLVSGQNADGSRVYVMVSPPVSTSCTASNASTQLRLDGSNQRGKYIMVLLSMAASQGKKITTSLSSCDDWGFPIIYDLQLAN